MPKGALRTRFRNRIAMHREGRGLTQAQLAARLGVHVTTIAHWETDTHVPSIRMVGLIARELRVTPRDLFPRDFA